MASWWKACKPAWKWQIYAANKPPTNQQSLTAVVHNEPPRLTAWRLLFRPVESPFVTAFLARKVYRTRKLVNWVNLGGRANTLAIPQPIAVA